MRRYLLLLTLAIGLGFPTASSATLVQTFSMSELVRESQDVIRGYVVQIQPLYDTVQKHIYTHTTIEVQEDIRTGSTAKRRIVVRQLGGALHGIETTLSGNAQLGIGEEVVLFARTDGAFHYVVGMAQGKYTVTRTKAGKPLLGRSLAGLRGLKRSAIALPQAPDSLSLDELRRQVRSAQKGGSGQ